MITLAFSGLGLAKTAARHLESNPDSCFWGAIKYQFSHVQWAGCGYWDMIQPSFMVVTQRSTSSPPSPRCSSV